MKRTASLSLLLVLSLAAVATAQPATSTPAPAKPVKVIDITEGEDVSGDRPTGELMPISARESAKSTSLIHIRHDFIDLILKAAESV